MATASDLVDLLLVAGPAAWLAIGVWDNIRFPEANRDDVARVLALEALKDYPELRRRVGHRAVTDPAVVRRIFVLMVAAEGLVVSLMLVAWLALVAAMPGWVGEGCARALAVLAMGGFCAIWLGFLIGGQWFYYWYGAFGQKTHFLALLWGLATLAVLA